MEQDSVLQDNRSTYFPRQPFYRACGAATNFALKGRKLPVLPELGNLSLKHFCTTAKLVS